MDATHLRWFTPVEPARGIRGGRLRRRLASGRSGRSAAVARSSTGCSAAGLRHLWHRQIDLRAHVPPV